MSAHARVPPFPLPLLPPPQTHTQRLQAVVEERTLDVWTRRPGPTRPVDVLVLTDDDRAAVEAVVMCELLNAGGTYVTRTARVAKRHRAVRYLTQPEKALRARQVQAMQRGPRADACDISRLFCLVPFLRRVGRVRHDRVARPCYVILTRRAATGQACPPRRAHRFFKQLAERYPVLTSLVPSIGQSHEGRDIVALRIKAVPKPAKTFVCVRCTATGR